MFSQPSLHVTSSTLAMNNSENNATKLANSFPTIMVDDVILLWHRRLGQSHFSVLRSVVKDMNVKPHVEINKVHFCEAC